MLNPRPGFRLYPRGFLGALPVPKVEKDRPQSTATIKHGQLHLTTFNPRDPQMNANDTVEHLYADYMKEAGEVLSMEFRTKVLHAALHAFGTTSFFHWFREQSSSPAFGDMHQRFLIDTLRFLQGNRREMALVVWDQVLDIEDATPLKSQYINLADEFFGATLRDAQAKRNDSVVDVIQLWCTRPNGIEDLLQTLHLLFGNT